MTRETTQVSADPKYPKQWKHWCQKAGLRQHTNRKGVRKGRALPDWLYLKGHGRVWRVNCHGMFQCGDTYAEFDRWALCDIVEAPRPGTLSEFLTTVRELLKSARAADVARAARRVEGLA